MRLTHQFLSLVPLLLAVACSGSGVRNPVEAGPPGGGSLVVRSPVGLEPNRYLWGLWEIRISADRHSAQVVPQRVAEMHLNCVRLLEVAPCTDCLTISNLVLNPPNGLTADLTLRHPYAGVLKLTGFDVRGIFISDADYTFPVGGRSIAWGSDLPRLLNPDGYTALFNPTDFPGTGPPWLCYTPGKYSIGGDLSATLNPFLAYRKDATRRMFDAGGIEARTAQLYLPGGPIKFGYAVDACWRKVDGQVTDPLKDFPPDANCTEAYNIDVQIGPGLDLSAGGTAEVLVEVFDHQGLETISSVTVEAPELFSGEVPLTLSTATGEESWLFNGMITNEAGVGGAGYPLLVRVRDTWEDQNLGAVDAWEIYSVAVGPEGGWARTWGEIAWDQGNGVAVDGSGNIYVAGDFGGTVDFDPGIGVDERSSNGEIDVFLSKFDSKGDFQWARTWGGETWEEANGVAADGLGEVYVTGCYQGTVDFDPGGGVDQHSSEGQGDIFLSKYDPDGNFEWARTWGGALGWERARGVAVEDPGNVWVTGCFSGTVDFDPGPGVDEHSSNGYADAFLSKFDSAGDFQWACTWGGPYWDDEGTGVAADGSGDGCVVTGYSHNEVFLNKFDSEGSLQWALTWGGAGDDEGLAVGVDPSGNVYVTGYFWYTVDFDPGPGVDEHSSAGYRDVFLSKFDSEGNFQWARTWGGVEVDEGFGVAADGSGEVYVTGYFQDTVDFDPGAGVKLCGAGGQFDVFLSRFDSAGDFQWARTWGGSSYDRGFGVATDGSGNAYVAGYFWETVDFDPGPGVDEHYSNLQDAFLSKFPPDGDW